MLAEWLIMENPINIWMTAGTYVILGKLHLETHAVVVGRAALPKHWPKWFCCSQRQCRMVGQRRDASNGWWAAKDILGKQKSNSSRITQDSPAGMIRGWLSTNLMLDSTLVWMKRIKSDKMLQRSKQTTSGINEPRTAAAAVQSSTSVSRRAALLTCGNHAPKNFWFLVLNVVNPVPSTYVYIHSTVYDIIIM